MERKNQFQERVLFERTENLMLVKVRDLRPYFIISLMVNIVIIASSFNNNENTIIKYQTIVKDKVAEVISMDTDIPLTDSAITEELVKQGCVLPNIALAQFKIESSHFKSKICKENKNIAGIKTSRSNFVKGMLNDHCAYDSYRDCIKDYIRIQNRYLENIDGRYAEDGGYVSLLKKM
jgi:uncharacterized FlgJ-related protein